MTSKMHKLVKAVWKISRVASKKMESKEARVEATNAAEAKLERSDG